MKINDLVTRKSHNHDIVFRVIAIEGSRVILQGEVVRLVADAPVDDLVLSTIEPTLLIPPLFYQNEMRNQVVSGLVLHIDGDERYLKKAIGAYREYGISAIGYHISEQDLPSKLLGLLKRHRPDILVITGHDALDGENKMDLRSYRNSKYFVESVMIARDYEPSKDALVIVAGACQSYYEALLKAGANFASSPTRENIHLLDPVIIASEVAHTNVNTYVPVKDILNHTISHRLGGIDTKGVARRLFVGGN